MERSHARNHHGISLAPTQKSHRAAFPRISHLVSFHPSDQVTRLIPPPSPLQVKGEACGFMLCSGRSVESQDISKKVDLRLLVQRLRRRFSDSLTLHPPSFQHPNHHHSNHNGNHRFSEPDLASDSSSPVRQPVLQIPPSKQAPCNLPSSVRTSPFHPIPQSPPAIILKVFQQSLASPNSLSPYILSIQTNHPGMMSNHIPPNLT